MSFNQSRSDKSETQYRKSGRSASFNHQRPSSGAYGKGAGPSPSSSSLSSNRSFKKSNNAQGGQSRVNVPVSNSLDSGNAPPPRNVPNGAHLQPPLHVSDAPAASNVTKPTEAPAPQRSTQAVPKAPTSQSASMTMSSDTALPAAPAKDTSKAFSFQFGSITPGFMNGMQVPARTSSAPPNLDEQKRNQAHHDSFRSVPPVATPTPKQQLPRMDVNVVDQTNTGEAHPVLKAKKETQVSPAPPVSQAQKPSVLPIPMASMPLPYHQPQVSMQFGGPSPQIQSQGVAATSLQMPLAMPLPIGNAPQMQQPVFVQGLHPHPMQHQGIMHQDQGMSFTAQMGPQLPQLGNLGIGFASQYSQQQGGNFNNPRKPTAVKITNPKTHEELRLDKRTDTCADGGSGLRSHPGMPQSKPIASFAASHPISYYGNTYGANGAFFPAPSSVPLTSSQMAPNSQPPRFNYAVNQGPQNVSFMSPSPLNTLPVTKPGAAYHGVADLSNTERTRRVHNVISSAPSGMVQVTVKPAGGATGEKFVDPPLSNSSSTVEKGVSHKYLRSSVEASSSHPQRHSETCSESLLQQPDGGSLESKSLPTVTVQPVVIGVDSVVPSSLSSVSTVQSEKLAPVVVNAEGRKETLSRSNSIKDHQRKSSKKGYIPPQLQICGQSTSVSSLSSRISEFSCSSNGVSGTSENATTILQIGGQSTSVSSLSSRISGCSSSSNGVSGTSENATTLYPLSVVSEALTESVKESVPAIGFVASNVPEAMINRADEDGLSGTLSQSSGASVIVDAPDAFCLDKTDDSSVWEQPKCNTEEIEKQGETGLKPEDDGQENVSVKISSVLATSNSVDPVHKTKDESALTAEAFGNEVPALEPSQGRLDEPVISHVQNDRMSDDIDASTSKILDSMDVEKSCSEYTLPSDAPLSKCDNEGNKEISITTTSTSDQQFAPVPTPDPSLTTLKQEGVENAGVGSLSLSVSGSKDNAVELIRSRSSTGKLKKKRREICQKADAAGTSSDLYMAYKGPEEKKENALYSQVTEITSTNLKQAPVDACQADSVVKEKSVQNKSEPVDWEDAADLSTPKLETSNSGERSQRGLVLHNNDENASTAKKYSRDFLLKFSEHCIDLPAGFKITSDIAEAFMSVSISHLVDRDSYPSPERVVDRRNSGTRMDRRGSVMVEDDRWSKVPGPFGPGRDLHVDIGYGGSAGFRPGPGGKYGVLRNPRAQASVQYAGGILAGPLQPMVSQGGMQKSSQDAERWQRATNFQRGLIPSPQTPLQIMHKAERKYEVGKVTDEEQAKQRQLKGILNKLTPQNFEKLFEQVKAVNIDNIVTLTGVISQIFDKALMEPTFCEMYANFCYHLAGVLRVNEDNEKITFKSLLLNKCQEEFERGEREQEEANKVEEEGEVKQSEEEREEKRIKARRRMLGNIRLIGELYKKKMLTERIMHDECIKKLLGQYQNPDEEDVEALCKLMSTIGEMIDHPRAKEHMDAYFERMEQLSNNMKLSSRVRFMLKDAIDLRKNKWQQRRKVEGPKKIEEVHRDAAQERQQQASRLARNPSINPSARRAAMDFGPRGSAMLSTPSSQMGSFRGFPGQVRGYGTQDVRSDERQAYEARTLSVPLPQRPLGDDSITLGPQGGLARGMSNRGPPTLASTPVADAPSSLSDSGRIAVLNGFSNISERPTYSPKEDLIPRYVDRSVPAAHDQMAQNIPSDKVWPEERLRDMSMAAIKEFYSARDEKEVALCVKDLNCPSFHPSMISLWVNDTFERKDMERDLLAKLLVSLTRSRDGILTAAELFKGFESVLTTLEDAVNDAPKAAEFLGSVLAKVVLENVLSLGEIGQLLYQGGEEPGRLLEIGLAGDVLGSTLGRIKAEKGESVLNEILTDSNLPLQDFRPPDPYR